MSTHQKPKVGDRGTYYPSAGILARERAEIVHVWTESCVNLKTESGALPTSVLIVADPTAHDSPEGYFFVPDQVVDAEFKPKSFVAEIAERAGAAPRVTPGDIEAEIASEHYFTADQGVAGAGYRIHNPNERGPLSLLTFCILVLHNGFTVTGESACASPENFDAETGRKIARQNAVAKVWQLLGFRLRDKLSSEA